MDEIHGIVEIQRHAWKMPDIEIVATFEMKAVSDFGICLVAVNEDDTPIGFIYGFPQFPNAHYSHMMAVMPEWHGKGIGFALKKAHRDIALSSPYNIEVINWTVDPLLANNAFLNFAKLGCECNTYYENYYGDPEAVGIYRGVPTDRFFVKWYLNADRVKLRMDDYRSDRIDKETLLSRSPNVNQIRDNTWISTHAISELSHFTIQIPSDYQKMKDVSLELAIDWRLKFRKLCQRVFALGWKVVDFHSFAGTQERENYYEYIKEVSD
ncbi:MAG: GNAT family N-acetyltransferase [Candidatus Kariarchaeaceae archaeon]|jgi:predicted GNAT superfamily acetyltransferase